MLLKRRKLRLCCFTLLELFVSMGVFAILMLALMQFFTSAQSIWTRSNTRYDMYDNARLALNLMATDLQCLYYDDYKTNAKYFDVSAFSGNAAFRFIKRLHQPCVGILSIRQSGRHIEV